MNIAGSNFFASSAVSFADVAHQTLNFDRNDKADQLILELLDTPWVQRLRNISQTGNTKLVYMFAEHSRFGHSLGVAYLASLLMKVLRQKSPGLVEKYEEAVAAAALLHDIGHVAPGSHLAERIWAPLSCGPHELLTCRIVAEDPDIGSILERRNPELKQQVLDILAQKDTVPPWTVSVIAGGGWNADRGNWSMVDSAMCAVTYGRYNVRALVDAFCLSAQGELLLQENRLDALTHFFVARDSMYRQVYQHRVLQAADVLTQNLVQRIRDILHESPGQGSAEISRHLAALDIYADDSMQELLKTHNYAVDMPLSSIFNMTEHWWFYHLGRWCFAKDPILADLAQRLRDRNLLKTIRLGTLENTAKPDNQQQLFDQACTAAQKLGFNPRYYVSIIEDQDRHRRQTEQLPMLALENGELVPVTSVEPLIEELMKRNAPNRRWLAVPKEVKATVGRLR